MGHSELWVGALTALTALGASWITARATSRAALAQARTAARAQALREQRERRRSTYREMMGCAHAFFEVTWQIDAVDAAPDREAGDRLLAQMYEHMAPAIGNLNRANHEVRLDGPAAVSDASERVRQAARRVQPRLKALAGATTPEPRRAYDAAFTDFRDAYTTFIGLARQALEAEEM
ncbi:hypothetical protein [Streptomyces lavendulae]|uniref:hypothetical protein n=1 Tax=Streptomyces lavendulae TaxID=1914 RepID=UPI0024A44E55|nr:hypothetical protein [Streptomyces lavendulae]GLX16822.1 hypothetical protein Slala01_04660 [Streptomyces lavendulae subsp. lavendulae]GLX25445.1 hypothetical protein Slala02_12650 [Streptomyces lavendulae subsp. lavendulae]